MNRNDPDTQTVQESEDIEWTGPYGDDEESIDGY